MENNSQEQINKDIMQKLIGQQNSSEENKDEEQVEISTARVSGVKYRIYTLIFLTLLVVLIIDYVIPSWEKTVNLKETITGKQQQINSFLNKKAQYEKDKNLIALIEKNENKIVSCVNYKVGCKELQQEIRENFGFARAYLQLNNLYDKKMEINEKIILANINEYLLKKIGSTNESSPIRIGRISSIAIGKPEVVVSQLFSIPIRIQANFVNKDNLLSFIENVDKNVLENKAYRILYKIEEINYNIMEYDQEQTVDINIKAFYYQE